MFFRGLIELLYKIKTPHHVDQDVPDWPQSLRFD